LLKREDVHELGAFKWRGALPVLERYAAEAVVTASTGNHGAATAWAARRLGMRCVVFVPAEASAPKLERIEALGAELRRVGADLDEAKDEARRLAHREGLPFFEDGAEPAQYEGYSAIADELLEQLGAPPAAVVVPVGNGALLGGIGSRLAALRVGVAAKEAPVMALSFEAGRPVECDRCATIADGLAVRVAIPYAVARLAEAADRFELVSEREIARGVARFADAGIRAEGAAGAALAAAGRLEPLGGPVVVVVTGRNIDDDLLERCRSRPESFRP
jgi:threonine dehydratase